MAGLTSLKKSYGKIQTQYKLPKFSVMNEDFEIEKLQDKETEYLIRAVRRVMVEKVANVVRFLELILNPSETPTPMFIFAMLKNLTTETRKSVEGLYKEMSSIELNSLTLDVSYNEKDEAGFVNSMFKSWLKIKPELQEITRKLGISWKKERKDRGYLG